MNIHKRADRAKLISALAQEAFKRLDIHIVYLETVDSTQTYLSSKLESEREGDVVVSEIQTSGKGRNGRTWSSQEGGMYVSISLRPPAPRILERIIYLAANGVIRTLADYGIESTIKSPNDIYCGGRKIAGILADTVIQGDSSIVYLGVGVNVNNDPSKDSTISEIATSMSNILGGDIDLTEFVISFLRHFDDLYYDEIQAQISHN